MSVWELFAPEVWREITPPIVDVVLVVRLLMLHRNSVRDTVKFALVSTLIRGVGIAKLSRISVSVMVIFNVSCTLDGGAVNKMRAVVAL